MIHDSPFDSSHYRTKVARLAIAHPGELDAQLAEARAAGYDLLLVRVDEEHVDLLAALDSRGYSALETLVTSRWDGVTTVESALPVEAHARLTATADIDMVATLTSETIGNTHMHNDPRLPVADTERLYAAWARNDVTGRAARTFVTRDERGISGYLTALRNEGTAVVDLIAVRREQQGRGLGRALLAAFLAWVRVERLAATVGTQSDNPALALYRRCGFVPITRQRTFHIWLR